LIDYINKNIKNKCVIHGVSSVLKNLKHDQHWIFTKKLTDDEILDLYKKEEIQLIHQELADHFAMLQNEKCLHRLVFGKDIQKGILQMTLKTLYCSEEKYEKLMKNIPNKYLTPNFQIYKVNILEKGDPGDLLKMNFSGAMGITYF
jgi:hypothetical protein